VHERDRAGPAFSLGRQLLFSGTRDLIEARLPIVLTRAPLARDPALLSEAKERRINRALIERERPLRHLLDAASDPIAVQGAHRVEGLKNDEVERAVLNFRSRRHRFLLTADMNSTAPPCWLSTGTRGIALDVLCIHYPYGAAAVARGKMELEGNSGLFRNIFSVGARALSWFLLRLDTQFPVVFLHVYLVFTIQLFRLLIS
jgi:hypothetical protein